MIKSILNNKLAGTSRPGKYNDLNKDLDKIRIEGYDVIISLYDKKIKEEIDFAKMDLTNWGFEHFSMEYCDYSIPEIKYAEEIIKLIDRKIKENKKVLVHCNAGLGRTGTILALYIKSKKKSIKDPIRYIRKYYNKFAIETKEQEVFIKNWQVKL